MATRGWRREDGDEYPPVEEAGGELDLAPKPTAAGLTTLAMPIIVAAAAPAARPRNATPRSPVRAAASHARQRNHQPVLPDGTRRGVA